MSAVTPAENATPRGDFVIVGVGARTSIGLNAMQTAMGIRAEVLRPVETRFVDPKGELIGMCCVSCLDPLVTGADRLVALARPAMLEAAAPWQRAEKARRGTAGPLPLVIALPEGMVQCSLVKKKSRFFEVLELAAEGLIDPHRAFEVIGGRAAGVQAMERAFSLLAEGAEAVLVGGVDSYFDPDRLDNLAADLRLHGLETENGFVPGEAAAFVVLTQRRRASALTRYANILGQAIEQEPRPYGSEGPCQGLGMTAAIRKATAVVGAQRCIGWRVTDVVNERHRVDEWQYASGRTFQCFTTDVRNEQPLLTVGDVGTASAALFIVEVSVRWHTGCALSDLAVLALHSDGPERGAILMAGEVG